MNALVVGLALDPLLDRDYLAEVNPVAAWMARVMWRDPMLAGVFGLLAGLLETYFLRTSSRTRELDVVKKIWANTWNPFLPSESKSRWLLVLGTVLICGITQISVKAAVGAIFVSQIVHIPIAGRYYEGVRQCFHDKNVLETLPPTITESKWANRSRWRGIAGTLISALALLVSVAFIGLNLRLFSEMPHEFEEMF